MALIQAGADVFRLNGAHIEEGSLRGWVRRVRRAAKTAAREVSVMVATKTTQEWLDILTPTPVPTMLVNTLEDLLEDPHLVETGFWKTYEHPTEGTIRLPDLPTRFSETPGSVRHLPPRLGEHSVEVLSAAGMSPDQIEAMLDSGATKVPKDD